MTSTGAGPGPLLDAASDDPAAAAPSARERILRAAHALFYREGIRATGVDRVIAESRVAKLTFYRHFPSKNDLVLAFLDARHTRWMQWFEAALARHGGTPEAIGPALAEWLRSPAFRGCAFINAVGEVGEALPEAAARARAHKQAMTRALATVLPAAPAARRGAAGARRPARARTAQALALAVDGAIVQAQRETDPAAALRALGLAVEAITSFYRTPPP